MANILLHGQYYIISVQDNEQLDVSKIIPAIFPPPPLPVIVLPREVVPPRPPFTVEPVNGGDNTYVIKVENRNTRGQEKRVFAFEDQPAEEWVIVYRELQGAYTIERRGEPVGWTVPLFEETELRQVVLEPIISTHSIPPQFLPRQLFRFEGLPVE
ncbi:hypothetical protein PISMIDRAFT_196824 [Pisolithus microcarpus 441]|uniref:Uncharacterized protein n=1 Tax=Pisolithus microcarpus 441 TaxID=765257 RepID=A0A0C9Z6X2_9AGAM|nr:hypothetical protein BKA83DRAFT_196824 [Pisolithus microcarpus]KIK18177.1 hypothetical protein PISMIDRAFT_196824 [Pisolithus microcarpus 441]